LLGDAATLSGRFLAHRLMKQTGLSEAGDQSRVGSERKSLWLSRLDPELARFSPS
jgi:hypothetical protein